MRLENMLVDGDPLAQLYDELREEFPPGVLFVDMRRVAEAHEGDEVWRQALFTPMQSFSAIRRLTVTETAGSHPRL